LALAAVGVPELFAFSAANKFSWAFLEVAKLALAIVVVPFESGVVVAI
jgi:long-subunit acyl-CoA synthetase (AMP-forming)